MMRKFQRGMIIVTVLAVTRLAFAQAPTITPGPELEKLRPLVGTWDCVIKSMGTESKGTAKYNMDLGGLWLMSRFEGDFGGMPFKGMGIDGYDPAKKKYVSVWVDSMSTAPMFSEGDYDAATKSLTLTGTGPGPGGSTVKNKMVTKFVDNDNIDFTMYTIGEDGAETEMMTIQYKRRKG